MFCFARFLLNALTVGTDEFGLVRLGGARSVGLAIWLACVFVLTGCDQLGIETPQKASERQQADAKAIGGACRHALRAIEDCYTLNPKADKAAVFTGWREMDEYMRENKLEGVVPVVPRPVAPAASKASAPKHDDEEDPSDKADGETPVKLSKQGKSKSH